MAAGASADEEDRPVAVAKTPLPPAQIQPQLVALTGDARIDGLLWGWKWGATNLTYRFPTSANEYFPAFPGGEGYQGISGFQPFSNFQANQIVGFGLNNLGVFSGLKFSPSNSFGGGNLRFAQADSIWYEQGHANSGPHGPGGGRSAEGNPPDPFFSTFSAMGDTWYIKGGYTNPVLGSFQYAAGLLHEIGHAIGLKHGHHTQTRSDGTSNPVTLPTLPFAQDSQEFSVMTYRSYIGHNPATQGASGREEYPWTYMLHDVRTLQYMYGANFGAGSNEGDTVYRFNPNTGEMSVNGFGFGGSYNAKVLLTIWDGGGRDTYDFSNHAADQRISLVPGEWSTFNPAQLANLSLGQQGNPVNLARGNVANAFQYQGDRRSLIEDAKGGSGNDRIDGNILGNALYGNGGNDTIRGAKGNDTLDGGDGADLLFGDEGNDRARGKAGADTLNGGAGNDTLFGGTEADRLAGDAGTDVLQGEEGNDQLFGGDGDDRGYGGAGSDSVNGGAGDDLLRGGDGDDRLSGGPGADQLFGDAGSDTLTGGTGPDTLAGGAGADRFVFATADSGATAATRDTVSDFRRGDGDRLDLRGIDGDAAAAGSQPLAFVGRDVAFTGARGEVRFVSATKLLEINTDADLAADITILLAGVNNIGAVDLIL